MNDVEPTKKRQKQRNKIEVASDIKFLKVTIIIQQANKIFLDIKRQM